AGDRAQALSSYGSASRFYAAAFDLLPDDDPERPYVTLKRESARLWLGETDVSATEWAIRLFVGRGDLLKAAEAESTLAKDHHHHGEGAESERHSDRSMELVSGLGPSEGKAFVLMESSRRAMLLQHPEGATVAREGLAIADELGLDGLRADLLNTLGICRLH